MPVHDAKRMSINAAITAFIIFLIYYLHFLHNNNVILQNECAESINIGSLTYACLV